MEQKNKLETKLDSNFNPKSNSNLIAGRSFEIVTTNSKKVSCENTIDEEGNLIGHPLVYLNLGKNNSVTCPYCSKTFKYEAKK